MADLRFGDEGGSDAQEPEYNGSSTSTRLPPLHRHMQGQGSAECESAGCTRPLQLPSLSALGIADTIHKESATMQAGALAASHLASEEFGLTHKQQAQCLQEEATGQHHVNDIDDQNRQQLDQTTEASGCALEILAAASFQSEAEAEARLSRDEPKEESAADTNEGGLAASVQQCLWSTCTQIFSSIDELVRHLYKLHVATNRTSIYSRAAAAMERQSRQMAQGTGSKEQGRLSGLEFLCEWASCETRACGAEELIDHVCKDHLDAAQVLHRCGWAGCGCEYETIDLLTEHLSAEHIGSGRSSYVCRWDGCERAGKPFAQRQRALRHIQTHTGAKPFSCQVCTKRFSEAHIMQQHLRVHTGEKPFKC
ncbi:zinc-finger protein, partial [Coemansia sp. RSA 1939]